MHFVLKKKSADMHRTIGGCPLNGKRSCVLSEYVRKKKVILIILFFLVTDLSAKSWCYLKAASFSLYVVSCHPKLFKFSENFSESW